MTDGTTSTRTALVPLILRIALGAIFIFHGVDKVTGPGTDWGASWATRLWQQERQPPGEVLTRLNLLATDTDEKRQMVKEAQTALGLAYAHAEPELPPGLQPHLSQLAVAWGELLCGLLLIAGLFTRVAALLMIVVQVGAIWTLTWDRGFTFASGGGYEYNLALLAMCVVLLLTGSGPLMAVDHWLFARRKPAAAAVPPPAKAEPAQPIV
jgi:uncharacterized membrane protein YphA (DoxX/SURF4 family)